jgi:hypothetical protein
MAAMAAQCKPGSRLTGGKSTARPSLLAGGLVKGRFSRLEKGRTPLQRPAFNIPTNQPFSPE